MRESRVMYRTVWIPVEKLEALDRVVGKGKRSKTVEALVDAFLEGESDEEDGMDSDRDGPTINGRVLDTIGRVLRDLPGVSGRGAGAVGSDAGKSHVVHRGRGERESV